MKRVLVVDDSPSVRQQVGLALGQAGFVVLEAEDGRSGLAMIDSAQPAAVVCDVNMPNMNGVELLEALRGRSGSNIPVLMLTTEANPAMMARARAAGAKGWMRKPFKADLLISAIEKLTA